MEHPHSQIITAYLTFGLKDCLQFWFW